ncbi:hypothetical protein R6Q59_010253 [Mikania micrantha]
MGCQWQVVACLLIEAGLLWPRFGMLLPYSMMLAACSLGLLLLSRSKTKEPQVTGTKSFARLANEVAMKNDGVCPTRGEMYIKTRTRKDGSVVDNEAASVVTSLKAIASDSTITPRDRDAFTRDDYSKFHTYGCCRYYQSRSRPSTLTHRYCQYRLKNTMQD